MATVNETNAEQAAHWGGTEGDHWVRNAQRHDTMLAPFGEALLDTALPIEGEHVLDVGCGCGALSLAAAVLVGDAGSVRGADLSPQMVEVATSRAAADGLSNAAFTVVDAQTGDLGSGSVDLVMSRFGVMFFDDPVVAFANMRRALRPDGRLVFCCWQGIAENEWMMVPGLAVAEHVELPDLGGGTDPGPFSMADPEHLSNLLQSAGFAEPRVDPFTTSVLLAGGGTLDDTVEYLVTSGLGRALLDDAPADARSAAIAAVRVALASHLGDEGVRLGGAAWIVSAGG